jgi:F0F1-type ATP synthase assembly protein I
VEESARERRRNKRAEKKQASGEETSERRRNKRAEKKQASGEETSERRKQEVAVSLLLWLVIAWAVGAGLVMLTYRIGFRAGLVAEDERLRIEESEAIVIAFERHRPLRVLR